MEEGNRAEQTAAAAATGAAPPMAGADASAAAHGEGGGVAEEVEGEDDGEVGPKVSRDKLSRALSAPRTPYAKPQAMVTDGGDAVSQNKRVYVGNLSWGVTWQDLKDHMRTAGEVVRADVLTGHDGRSKGCGIVEYATVEEAAGAVASLNNTDLQGRPIFVREDREKEGGGGAKPRGGGGTSVYVGNLAYEVAWQDLKDHMRDAGEVVHAEVMTMHDGRSKGCGVVKFETAAGARAAIETLNDTELKGRQIFVREDREQGGGGGGGGGPKREGDGGYQAGYQQHRGGGGRGGYGNLSVYVGNLAYDTSWQNLKDHMRAAGNVDKADILTNADGTSKGCGIVLYQKPAEAARAIRELNGVEFNGRPIFVREDREQSGHRGHGHGGGGGYHSGGGRGGYHGGHGGHGGGGYQAGYQQQGGGYHQQGFQAAIMPGEPAEHGCQLFVGNLSWQSGWQDLKDLFREYGEVERADVVSGPDGRSRGFGFIRFGNAGDAQNAIAGLNGAEFMGRNIEVRLDNKSN
ncbi:hypothetical protein ACHAXT_002084 [Thalassiosira profunda]